MLLRATGPPEASCHRHSAFCRPGRGSAPQQKVSAQLEPNGDSIMLGCPLPRCHARIMQIIGE